MPGMPGSKQSKQYAQQHHPAKHHHQGYHHPRDSRNDASEVRNSMSYESRGTISKNISNDMMKDDHSLATATTAAFTSYAGSHSQCPWTTDPSHPNMAQKLSCHTPDGPRRPDHIPIDSKVPPRTAHIPSRLGIIPSPWTPSIRSYGLLDRVHTAS